MKKILFIGFTALAFSPLLASAQTATTTSVSLQTKRVCAVAAIEKRDSSIITLHNSFNTSIVSALTVRKDSLKAAYMLEPKNSTEAARKAAWAKFKTDSQAAHNTLRSARKTTWNTFNTDMRTCGMAHKETPHAVLSPSVSL